MLGERLGLPVRAQAPGGLPAKAALKPASQKTFQRENLASDGVRLEAALKAEAGPSRPAARARAEGEALMQAEKPDEAVKPLGGAVAAEPGNPANWLAYARAASAAGNADTGDYSSRMRLRRNARAAAYVGYLRAATAAGSSGVACSPMRRMTWGK